MPPPGITIAGDYHRVPVAGREAPAFTMRTRPPEGRDDGSGSPGAGTYNPEMPGLPSAPAFTMRAKTPGGGADEPTEGPGGWE